MRAVLPVSSLRLTRPATWALAASPGADRADIERPAGRGAIKIASQASLIVPASASSKVCMRLARVYASKTGARDRKRVSLGLTLGFRDTT